MNRWRLLATLMLLSLTPALTWAALPSEELWRENVLSEHVGFGTVTGGAGQTLCTVTNTNNTGAGSLRNCVASNRWIIFTDGLTGTITFSGTMNIIGFSNITIDGREANITISGAGIWIDNSTNIAIMYLKFANQSDDGMTILDGSSNVWIHHITSGTVVGDETIDIGPCDSSESGVPGVTISWSHFVPTPASQGPILIASNGTVGTGIAGDCNLDTTVTLHHNYYNQVDRRTPLMRFARVHSFNNYYKNTVDGGRGAIAAQIRSQGQFNSENDIFDADDSFTSGYPRVKAINDNPGDNDHDPNNVRVVGQWSVTGEEDYETLNPGTIFTPSSFYSYSLETAIDNTTLRDAIVAGAGWNAGPFDADTTAPAAPTGLRVVSP